MISNLQSTQPFFFWLLFCCWHIHCTHVSKFLLLYCIFFGRVVFEVWEKGCSNFRIIGTKKFYLWLNMLRATRKHTFLGYLNYGLFFQQKKLNTSKSKIYLKIIQKLIWKLHNQTHIEFGHPCDYCCYYYIFLSKPAFNSLFAIFIFIFFF